MKIDLKGFDKTDSKIEHGFHIHKKGSDRDSLYTFLDGKQQAQRTGLNAEEKGIILGTSKVHVSKG